MKYIVLCATLLLSTIAEAQVDSLKRVIYLTDDVEQRSYLYLKLAKLFYPDNCDSLLFYTSKATAEKNLPQDILAEANILKGMGYYILGSYDKVIEVETKALDYFQKKKDMKKVAMLYNDLGVDLAALDKNMLAVEYHWKSVGIATSIGDSVRIGKNYINIAVAYEESMHLDSALLYSEKAIEIFSLLKHSRLLAMSYNRKAYTLYRMQRYDEATRLNLYVLDNFPTLNKWEEGFTYLGLAQNYLAIGAIGDCIHNGLKGYTIAKELKGMWDLKQLAKTLSEAYASQEDYENAYQYYVEYKALSDTLFNENSERRINSLLLKQKDLENTQLAQENRLKEEALVIKNQQILLVLSGLGFIIILFILQYRNSKRLSVLNNRLNELNATKDKFFSIIAHDLRSPFHAMTDFLKVFREGVSDWSEQELREFSGLMLSSTNNVYKLLENLLEWASLQTNSISFNPQEFSINELIEENSTILNQIAKKKQIALKHSDTENTKVYADRNMVGTILRNLTNNALKFTDKGGEVIINHQVSDRQVEVTISDTGRGIPQAMKTKIFKPSEKYSTLGTAQEEGTGLGLVLCKEFVERHGRKLTVESTEGKGSTFSFTLPLEK